jgi:hypothetical protein
MGIKEIVIGIAIIILSISVVVYGINTFYERPDYEDYCGDKSTIGFVETKSECDSVGGKWTTYVEHDEVLRPVEGKAEGWCDVSYYCREEYDNDLETYSRNLFLIALPLGIIIIIVGAVVFGLEAVGAGLMGGGVGVILYGVGNYWRYSADLLKFLLSLIGLIIVIYFAYWFNKKKR